MTRQIEEDEKPALKLYLENSVNAARNAYGERFQVIVAMEELCELSCALAKFQRYDTPEEAVKQTRDKVISEFADALVMLETVKQIYGFGQAELDSQVEGKLDRLNRWLSKSSNPTLTTIDREISQ